MQLALALLLAGLASVELAHAASFPPSIAPASSLQNNKQKRDAYKSRQATSRDIIRRKKEGPRKRQ